MFLEETPHNYLPHTVLNSDPTSVSIQNAEAMFMCDSCRARGSNHREKVDVPGPAGRCEPNNDFIIAFHS